MIHIEGIPVQFCSDRNDASYADAAPLNRQTLQRYPGLSTDGWSFSEKIDIVQGKLEAEGVSVKIADTNAVYRDSTNAKHRFLTATSVFGNTPSVTTYLTADITDAVTDIPVLSTTGFENVDTEPDGTAWIGIEALLYDTLAAAQITVTGGVGRGAWRSTATYHYVYDGTGGASESAFTPVTNQPVHFEGRKVEFFLYDAGETININSHSPASGDTPFWTGIISAEPSYDGTSWSFTVDPITSVLRQKIGAQLGESVGIRGIYYPAAAPFTLTIVEYNAASSAAASGITDEVSFAMAGFWETQDAFIAALNTQIAAAITLSGSFTQTQVRARVAEDGTWTITFTTAATPHFMWFSGHAPNRCFSMVDGVSDGNYVLASGAAVATVSASTEYDAIIIPQPGLAGHGTVPRTTLGSAEYGRNIRTLIDNESLLININRTTFPERRIYVGGAAALNPYGTAVQLTWRANGQGRETTQTSSYGSVTSNDASRWVEPGISWVPHAAYVATAANIPELRFGLNLGTGTIATLLTSIETQAPQYAPLGAVPMIRASDIGSMSALTEAAASSSLTTDRRFVLFSSHDLEEVVAQELRLLGCFPCIGASGEITFARLRFAIGGEGTAFDTSDFIVDRGRVARVERAPYGLINLWTLNTGYNPDSDEHEGVPIQVLDVESRSNAGKTRELVIKPFSSEAIDLTDPVTEAQKLASKMLGVLGGPYQTITFRAPLSRWDTRCGTVISVTHPRIPNGEGGLGLTNKPMYVIGRTIKPRQAFVELTCLMTYARVGGYSPSARVLNANITGTTGTTGPFTVTMEADYFPSGAVASDFWATGDLIRVFVWNNATPGTILGTVTGASSTLRVLSFTTTTNWTRGTSDWVVGSRVSSAVSSDTQQRYAYEAGASGRVDFADDDVSAYVFA